jgi:hypothetical protein
MNPKKDARVSVVRGLIQSEHYEFSLHAERERQANKITIAEVEKALESCEIIEAYPNDPRGASFLVLGFASKRPIHAVCALKTNPREVFLITLYDPSKRPEKWTDNYYRRRSKEDDEMSIS